MTASWTRTRFLRIVAPVALVLAVSCAGDDERLPAVNASSLPPDSHEPNDDPIVCSTVSLGFSQTGLTLHDEKDDDFYCFTLNAAATVKVWAGFNHADGNIDLELRYPNGEVIDKSKTKKDVEVIVFPLVAGTYLVKVYSPSNRTNVYALEISEL